MAALKKTTTNWIATSKYDIETASHMLKTRRYIYVVFLCHLAIEKFLKALVTESQARHPPYTHDLYELTKLAQIDIPEEHQEIIAKLNELSIATRYPEDMQELVRSFPRPITQQLLKESKAFLKWLGRDPRLKS